MNQVLLVVWRPEPQWGIVPKHGGWATQSSWRRQLQRGSCPSSDGRCLPGRVQLEEGPLHPAYTSGHPLLTLGESFPPRPGALHVSPGDAAREVGRASSGFSAKEMDC